MLKGHASLKDGGAQLGGVVEVLRGHGTVALLAQRREGVGEHVEDVADANHRSDLRSLSVHSRTLPGSSNQYSLSIGMSS